MVVEEGNNDDGNIEVWSTNSEDEDVCRPAHGSCFSVNNFTCVKDRKCLMVKSVSSEDQEGCSENGGLSDGENSYASCFFAKSTRENMEACNKLTYKVHSICKYLDTPVYQYSDELIEL